MKCIRTQTFAPVTTAQFICSSLCPDEASRRQLRARSHARSSHARRSHRRGALPARRTARPTMRGPAEEPLMARTFAAFAAGVAPSRRPLRRRRRRAAQRRHVSAARGRGRGGWTAANDGRANQQGYRTDGQYSAVERRFVGRRAKQRRIDPLKRRRPWSHTHATHNAACAGHHASPTAARSAASGGGGGSPPCLATLWWSNLYAMV